MHFKLLGILAGVWPCGVMCVISELFQTESLTQVYGILHELLDQNVVKMWTKCILKAIQIHGVWQTAMQEMLKI